MQAASQRAPTHAAKPSTSRALTATPCSTT